MANQLGKRARARERPALAIAAAAFVTILDGFDLVTLSLTAPHLIKELGFVTAALGMIFAAATAGMIAGALSGGIMADKLGRLATLLVALVIFGAASIAMLKMSTLPEVCANRFFGGLGLGAAAPIAVALLTKEGARAPSDLVVTGVWSGIGVGGLLAATYSYLVVPTAGWQSMFLIGGIIPIPVGFLAITAFSARIGQKKKVIASSRPSLRLLFSDSRAWPTILTAFMFMFGYGTSSTIVNWLPTILAHKSTPPILIASAFGALNVGGFTASFLLGALVTHFRSRKIIPVVWGSAGILGLIAAKSGLSSAPLIISAVGCASLAIGAQALSVSFASELHRRHRLEATTVGLMSAMGRVGQFGAASLSGAMIRFGVRESALFAIAGTSAAIAALLAIAAVRSLRRIDA